jgi:hypothetical protein
MTEPTDLEYSSMLIARLNTKVYGKMIYSMVKVAKLGDGLGNLAHHMKVNSLRGKNKGKVASNGKMGHIMKETL